MVATTTRTRKEKPITVEVVPLDVAAGLYSALSSDGSTWYLADVKDRTCTCPAGARQFAHCTRGACKHLIASRVVARGLASMTPAARTAMLRTLTAGAVRVHVERVDLAALDAPLARAATAPAARPTSAAAPAGGPNKSGGASGLVALGATRPPFLSLAAAVG